MTMFVYDAGDDFAYSDEESWEAAEALADKRGWELLGIREGAQIPGPDWLTNDEEKLH